MVPSRILCTPGTCMGQFSFFHFVHGCGFLCGAHKLYWSRNNKIENRIFCPQESTIAISRCLLLLPAVFNLRVVPFTYQTSNVVFCFCVWPHSFFKFEVWIILLFFDQKLIIVHRIAIAPNHASPSHCHRLLNGSLQYGPHQPGGKSRSTLADLILSLH